MRWFIDIVPAFLMSFIQTGKNGALRVAGLNISVTKNVAGVNNNALTTNQVASKIRPGSKNI